MTTDLLSILANKTERAGSFLRAVQSGAATIAADEKTTAKNWGEYALRLAQAEGALAAWDRMLAVAIHQNAKGEPVDIRGAAMDLLTQGADDTWSGRGNDLARARFDGIREACTEMKSL